MGRSKKKDQKEEKIDFTIKLTKRAEYNLKSSFNWYEEKRAELGSEFLLSVEANFLILQRSPFRFRIRYLNIIRAIPLKRFPFLVFYIIDGSSIIILAVLHFKQDHTTFLKKYTHE